MNNRVVGPYLQAFRRFSPNVRLYLATSVVVGFTIYGGMYAVILNLYLLRLGYSTEFVGLVNGAGISCYALFSMPFAMLGARFGFLRMLIIGLAMATLGFFSLPLAELVDGAARAVWLVAAYLIANVGAICYFVSSHPFLMGSSRPGERNYVYSSQMAILPLAAFGGSLIGGLLPGAFAALLDVSLADSAPYRYTLITATAVTLPALLIMLRAREVRGGQAVRGEMAPVHIPLVVFAVLAAVVALRGSGDGAARTFMNVYLDSGLGVQTAQIGTILGAGQLAAVPAALATPWLAGRLGNGLAVCVAGAGITLSLLPIALVPHWAGSVAGYLGLMASWAVGATASSVFMLEMVPQQQRAVLVGFINTGWGLGWTSMAVGGGYLIGWLGYPSLFLISATVSAMGALAFGLYFVRTPRGLYALKQRERAGLETAIPKPAGPVT